MEACAVICWKATIMLPGANPLSSRAQNCHFCALLAFGTPFFWVFEHKIGVFVSEWAIFPLFSALQSTKSAFLCSSYRRRLRGCWPGGGKCGLWEEKSAHILGLRAFTNLSCCSECRSARSAILPGAPLYPECLPTTCWPGYEGPGNKEPGSEEPGYESRGTKGRRVYRRQRLRKCWCIVVSWLSSGWKAVTRWLPCCAATIFPSTVASTFTPSPTSLM